MSDSDWDDFGDPLPFPIDVPWVGSQAGGAFSRSPRVVAPATAAEATLIEVLSRREVVFSGRDSQTETVPFPVFDSHRYRSGVLSVVVHAKASFLATNQLVVRVQNAIRTYDDPRVIFATDLASLTIASTTSGLQSTSLTAGLGSALGGGLRLRLDWVQGAFPNLTPARCTLSAFVTLRPA
jgi:hypothetical protein